MNKNKQLVGTDLMSLYKAQGSPIRDQQILSLLFDSKSIDRKMPDLSRRAIALLNYNGVNSLIFQRTAFSTNNTLLMQIPEVHFIRKDGYAYIETPDKGRHGVNDSATLASQAFGSDILQQETLNSEILETIRLIFFQEALNRFRNKSLLVTEDPILLTNRVYFRSKLASTPLNILSMAEAVEYIDLWFKHKSQFFISRNFTTTKNLWYWYSFRLKVPHYNVETTKSNRSKVSEYLTNSMMTGFSQRLCFLLMCLDEMGTKFYSGISNSTMDDMIYHFNYFILLMTGTFDSLAIQTMNLYKLTFEDSNIRSRISLNSRNGKKFLSALKVKNPLLRGHVQQNCDLIKIPYLLREVIVHREGLCGTTFDDNGWQANLLSVRPDFVECLRHLGDTNQNNEQTTNFGIHNGAFLSPFIFSKQISRLLFPFCDKYLELMGYPNFLEQHPDDGTFGSFSNTIGKFRQYNIGF